MNTRIALVLAVVAAALVGRSEANPWPINWVQWDTSFTTGATDGAATGWAYGAKVTYSGEVEDISFGYPSWAPPATFEGGWGTPPWLGDGMVVLHGGTGAVNTIKMDVWVTNFYLAIWSLGNPDQPAIFDFSPDIAVVVSGGPSDEYGGSSIIDLGNGVIWGAEGNGVVLIPGPQWKISWTNPDAENFYGFTFGIGGVNACAPPVPSERGTKSALLGCGPPIPEPMTLALFGAGLCAVGILIWRRRRRT